MADLDMALAANLAAAGEFVTATDKLGSVWNTPRAPGKWSPAQLLEHLVLAHIEAGKIIKGMPVAVPNIPWFLRPLLRRFWLRRILESGDFGRPMKTSAPFEPRNPPASPAVGRDRLLAAVRMFEADARSATPIGDYRFTHPSFGTLAVSDYVRFQEIHTRHHLKQLPKA